MFRYLQGKVLERMPDRVILLVGGIGFEVFCPAEILASLATGQEASLQVRLVVREDSMTLFGFADTVGLELFDLLIGVSGVGPRLALALLSTLEPKLFVQAIVGKDIGLLKATPGVGARLAERIALELSGKIPPHLAVGQPVGTIDPVEVDQAVEALITLGFRESSVHTAVGEVARQDPQADVQALIKLALKRLR